ncbi:MAG: hypothetical protein JW942_02880 [Opitutales bacterium]|nr:hypothetical protein [Opitutales bacterium]
MRTGSQKRAFTLLEVTLAAAIFATSVVVLTSAFSNALTALSIRRQEAVMEPTIRFLRSKIITVANVEQFEQGQDLYLPNGDTARWNATTEQMPIADLFKVHLHIEIDSDTPERATERDEVLYLLRPTWSQSDEREDIIEDAERALETNRRSIAQ